MLEIKNDFAKGSVVRNILSMAVPMTIAQLVNVLYNIVDRIYIGRMPENAFLALTGVGICLPVVSVVMAFANLFGTGGGPLCSIERGRANFEEAENIQGNSFLMLFASGILLTVVGLLIKKPILFLFGASAQTFHFADQYLTIYLFGNVFVMISLGMNHFINAQGFGKVGMITVVIGAIANILLDPLFIFTLKLGIQGAALATIISQFLSTVWVLQFLTGKKATLQLTKNSFILKKARVARILGLGISGFIMQFNNSLVQMLSNITLHQFGGDLYIGIMTIIHSIREIMVMPIRGLCSGARPVISFNYGAFQYHRVKSSIRFTTITGVLYTGFAWLVMQSIPGFFFRIFTDDSRILSAGIPVLRLYYAGFFILALMFVGQSTFVALGKSKQAIFFSIFRKVILIIPLILILPRLWGLGTTGVFLAEPVSEFVSGIACYTAMLFTIRKELSINRRQQPNCHNLY